MSYQLLKIGIYIYIYKYTTQGRPFLEESSLPPPMAGPMQKWSLVDGFIGEKKLFSMVQLGLWA